MKLILLITEVIKLYLLFSKYDYFFILCIDKMELVLDPIVIDGELPIGGYQKINDLVTYGYIDLGIIVFIIMVIIILIWCVYQTKVNKIIGNDDRLRAEE